MEIAIMIMFALELVAATLQLVRAIWEEKTNA